MKVEKNPENQMKSNEEPVISGEVKDEPNEGADEIKSQIEEDIRQIQENESAPGKDWGVEFKTLEDKYLRLYADFENYKRRTVSERIELFRMANQEVLISLLPVLDDFERALKSMQDASPAIKEGIELYIRLLNQVLF